MMTWMDYNRIGLARSESGDYQGAVDDYTQAIRLNPEDEVSYLRRGYARMQLGDYEGAINDNTQSRRNK